MCKECGCGLGGGFTGGDLPEPETAPIHRASRNSPNHEGPVHEPPRISSHDHDRRSEGGESHTHHDSEAHLRGHQVVAVQKSLLEKNDRLAEQNRGFFRAKKLLVLNVLSAPGSGKTSFIQKTVEVLGKRLRAGVVVGDLATDCDSSRMRAAGIPVVQITTGTLCHLEAEMVARAMSGLDLDSLDVLVIENVGNLVCPAAYDLGEHLRVVLLSVTEGEDKPLKYPPLFHSAQVAVLAKCDLAAAVDFDRAQALTNLGRISHHARVFETSARTGQGFDEWCAFLVSQRELLFAERSAG
jgi:hydrogenase nickel incorporation protein HypB